MHFNQAALVQGIVSELGGLNYPKATEGVDSPRAYFECVANDDRGSLDLRLNANKYLQLITCIQGSASGWINHQMYTRLLEKSINQYVLQG